MFRHEEWSLDQFTKEEFDALCIKLKVLNYGEVLHPYTRRDPKLIQYSLLDLSDAVSGDGMILNVTTAGSGLLRFGCATLKLWLEPDDDTLF